MCFSKYGFGEYSLKPGSFTLQMQSQEITKQGILSSQQGNLHILTSKIGRIPSMPFSCVSISGSDGPNYTFKPQTRWIQWEKIL